MTTNNIYEIINKIALSLLQINDKLNFCNNSTDVLRVIYSAAAITGLISLRDQTEQTLLKEDSSISGREVSIIHFKNRIKKFLHVFSESYKFPNNDYDIVTEELYRIYLNLGYFYHRNNWIRECVYKEATVGNIKFIKGVIYNDNLHMSGAGPYFYSNYHVDEFDKFVEMFAIPDQPYESVFEQLVSSSSFSSLNVVNNTSIEYLNTNFKPYQKYWINKCNSNELSILRTGEQGNYIYYFYKNSNIGIEVSRIPDSFVQNEEYLRIARYILSRKGISIPIVYSHLKNSLIKIKFSYLLPPTEDRIFRLYSWPCDRTNMANRFEREMPSVVFDSFKKIFIKLGYEFKEI